jgi:hypothetical protein
MKRISYLLVTSLVLVALMGAAVEMETVQPSQWTEVQWLVYLVGWMLMTIPF